MAISASSRSPGAWQPAFGISRSMQFDNYQKCDLTELRKALRIFPRLMIISGAVFDLRGSPRAS